MTNNNSWTIRGGKVFTPSPFALFGILNLTPDSFSDGGKFFAPQRALDHAHALWSQGASFLDLGAESSRPNAKPISSSEELSRLLPVLKPLLATHEKLSALPLSTPSNTDFEHNASCQKLIQFPYISVDTYHAHTAKIALQLGAHIINDISACLFEPQMLEIICEYKPGYILMHSSARPEIMQNNITKDNILKTLQFFFEKQLHRFTKAGLPEEHIMLDLGIGFGKSVEQNLTLLQNIHTFKHFGRPILAAISMKSFLHKFLKFDMEDLDTRSLATSLFTGYLGQQGIAYHRVHFVKNCLDALNIAQLFLKTHDNP